MTKRISKTIVAFGLLVATAFTSQASANPIEYLDSLAVRVEKSVCKLNRKLDIYRDTPGYACVRREAKGMHRLASHLPETVYRADINRMAADIAALDANLHRFEIVFDRVSRAAYLHCPSTGANSAHVRRLMRSIENDLYRFARAVDRLRRPTCGYARPIRDYSTPKYSHYDRPIRYGNTYGLGYGPGNGITIGGKNFPQLTFRF